MSFAMWVVATGLSLAFVAEGPLADARTHAGDSLTVPLVVARVLPAVVSITTRQIERDQFNRAIPTRGLGSGVIIDRRGYILTNQHVIDGAVEVKITLTDGRSFLAAVVGSDPSTDLAVLKIDASNLRAARLGDSSRLMMGQTVIAIGNLAVSTWACRVLLASIAPLVAATAAHSPVAAAEVEISAAALRPQTAVAAVEERVTFVDRSGRRPHLEFPELPRGHRVFQVPGEIWAVFHAPGRHGYTVHLSDPTMELHGVVGVREAPEPAGEPRECRGVSVHGECLDR